jgi:hypothetical protein
LRRGEGGRIARAWLGLMAWGFECARGRVTTGYEPFGSDPITRARNILRGLMNLLRGLITYHTEGGLTTCCDGGRTSRGGPFVHRLWGGPVSWSHFQGGLVLLSHFRLGLILSRGGLVHFFRGGPVRIFRGGCIALRPISRFGGEGLCVGGRR